MLIVAATEFNATHSFLTAGLVFMFSLGYYFASVTTRRAGFLYGAMLFHAVAFFMLSYGLGAPVTSFPLLSVVLVVLLLIVGHRLTRLPEALKSFPLTIFRLMNITVVVFSVWALVQVSALMRQPGLIKHVAAFTFLGYAGVYMMHRMKGQRSVYTYLCALCLMLGSLFLVGGLWSGDTAWVGALASAGAVLLVGTGLHHDKGCDWSRHFYICSAPMLCVSLIGTLWQWPLPLLDLALVSLLLWIAYARLDRAVEGAAGATMLERVVAKCFFFGAVGLTAPVVPMLFIEPGNLVVALAGLVCGLTFALIAWQRRGQAEHGDSFVLGSVMFVSAGLLGLGRQLPGISGTLWALAMPLAILGGLGLLCVHLEKLGDVITRRRIAVAAVFPVFFAWCFLVMYDRWVMAISAASMVTAMVVYLGVSLKERSYYYAMGPSLAGMFIAAVLLPGNAIMAWVACAAGAVGTGLLFVWADMSARPILRGAANLAWLILSIAAVTIAWPGEASGLLACVTAVGAAAVLMAWRPNRGPRDVSEWFAQAMAMLTTAAAVVMAAWLPALGVSVVVVGICLLILAAAYWWVWAAQEERDAARLANMLFALGALAIVFGVFPGIEVRVGLGAVVVLIMFSLAALGRRQFTAMAGSAVVTGHLISLVLAVTAVMQAWSVEVSRLYLAALPMVACYAFMPGLRTNQGLRLGTALWMSFALLFGIAAYTQTPYEQQIHLMVGLSLVWVVLGMITDRAKTEGAKAWSMPLYKTAAMVACFCCVVRILAPVTETSWLVFLASGAAFVSLFLIIREDLFVYLLSVALALMGYDWLRGTSSIFTADIYFWLVIVGVLLGATFLLPYLTRWLTRLGSVPMFSLFTGFGVGLVLLVVAVIGLVPLGAYGLKITGHPKFCASCHNMEDYYASWEHSSHKDIACVACHTEPGVAGTLAAKAQGMVQLVEYVSGSYGTRPHGEISSASCQQVGCHETTGQDDAVVMLYDRIKFRHDKHLNDNPNGKSLNCVSCHGQTVQGQHISVSKTTCLTCHFYGRDEQQVAAADCLICHSMPDQPVTFVDEPFSHQDFITEGRDVTCIHCHSQVTQGSGSVSRTRCMACHLEVDDEVEDQEAFHLIHVSEGHFDCLNCHEEIRHGESPMAAQMLTSNNCTTCHGGKRHDIQEVIYAGTALAGMDVMPDVMYEAGVACDGCHDESQTIQMGDITLTSRLSGGQQCVACHGDADYADQLTTWQETTREMIDGLLPALEQLETAIDASQASPDQVTQARDLLASARLKLEFVLKDGSEGAHNIAYVMEILDKATEEADLGQSLVK
ncbi:MAG: NapC/NirT family cytochrome c [Phycisphaerae bacterium]|nr:NapC/NirT family cytochrome c [Phycisphaerae bacterium]